jgi:Acyl-CoA dehydrogenase, C-terminal domain
VKLHGNWKVGALKGTGNQDFSVEDVFVPEYLTTEFLASPKARRSPVQQHRPAHPPHQRGPRLALGAARRSVEEMTAVAKSKTRGYLAPQGVAARGAFQLDLGRADLQLRAARAGVLEVWRGGLGARWRVRRATSRHRSHYTPGPSTSPTSPPRCASTCSATPAPGRCSAAT